MKTVVGEGGRIVIPANYRKAMGIKPGDNVILNLQDDELRVISARKAILRAQAIVRKYVGEGRSLSEELIQERRRETNRE